jgi:hypothetical protein
MTDPRWQGHRGEGPEPGGRFFVSPSMAKFLLWVLLFLLCWPLALMALLLYPVVWLLLLPFRLLGFAVEGVLQLVRAIFLLPSRVLGARP